MDGNTPTLPPFTPIPSNQRLTAEHVLEAVRRGANTASDIACVVYGAQERPYSRSYPKKGTRKVCANNRGVDRVTGMLRRLVMSATLVREGEGKGAVMYRIAS